MRCEYYGNSRLLKHRANRCDSELHSAAYRAERAERELGLTVVLIVCGVNIVMGTADC